MRNDNHYGGDSWLKGIEGARWLTYVRPVKPDNDATFSINDTNINDACDVTVSHCQPKPISPETLT